MDTNALQQLKDVLSQNTRIGIMVGKNPAIDDMAAALALYLSLRSANKQVTIASVTQPIVEFSSLIGIDQVKSSIGGTSGDLVVSFPYQEGEIEKVSYTIENGFLNIVVKAGENGLAFSEQDVRFTRGGGGLPSLLIVVGTAQLAALGDLFNPEALKNTTIVNIDNKPENQGFGDIVLLGTQYSTVSEVMVNILLSENMPMDVDTAQNLLNGIMAGTSNFQSPTTSFYAFEMVAELMRRGAVRSPMAMPQMQPRPQQTPSFMQPQSQMPQQPSMPRPQVQRPQGGMQRQQSQFGQPQQPQQQRGGQQQQSRIGGQRMNQGQGQHQNQQRNQQQNQQNRQDEIRRALAEQARIARENQQMQQMNQQGTQQQPQQQMPQQPPMPRQSQQMNQPAQQPQEPMQSQQSADMPEEAPSDWLTPKVYKGSTNIS